MDTASNGNNRSVSEDIERRRTQFEQNWGQPDAPTIEQLLDEVPKEEQSDLLRELLYVEFEFAQRKATDLILEQYVARFPEHEFIVREVAAAVGRYNVFQKRSIAGYTLLGELGRGGMGIVYKAKSDLLNNFVAFKMISKRMVSNPESLRRFTRELEMIGRLKHPNIVEAKHAGVDPDGVPFLVMELVEGVSLAQWCKQNLPTESVSPKAPEATHIIGGSSASNIERKKMFERQLDPSRIATACKIIRDVAMGLQAIHEAGLVHRDIKPANIMLLPDGSVKILDLGLAKLREHIAENTLEYEPQTRQGHLLGTPAYMAPEQMRSAAHVDIRADIYSLGCTFFFLLYGREPANNQTKEPPASLPQKLRTILDRMLAADSAARFQEPHEVVAALDTFLGSPRKFRLPKIAALAFLCVFIGGGLYATLLVPKSKNKEEVQPSALPEILQSVDTETITVEGIVAKKQPTAADVQAAIDLRYRGNGEQALSVLKTLENDLRTEPFEGSNELLAEVLAAQGDCLFFNGLASETLPEKTVKRLADRYEEALTLSEHSVLRTGLLCKLAVVNGTPLPSGTGASSLYHRFAEAVMATDNQTLRRFVEQFELSTESELMTREALDLRLFALERLISRSAKTDPENFPKDLRSLDNILLAPYPDTDSCVYLNRFFDLAIRVCEPTDYGQLVKYLYRLRPQGTMGTRVSFPPGSTLVLIYFSSWSEENGFAVYYPAERRESQRFELPFNRQAVKEAIKHGESLPLDATLVSLIRRDIDAGVPIVLSWDDTACWSLRRDAFSNEDWVFDESITLEEMLGKMM